MTVHNIKSVDEWKEQTSSGLVVVDCFATWCGPCKTIAPALVKLSDEFPQAKFLKIDVDELPDIAGEHSVSAMPTFLFFKDGKPLSQADHPDLSEGRVIGANINKLRAGIETLVGGKA